MAIKTLRFGEAFYSTRDGGGKIFVVFGKSSLGDLSIETLGSNGITIDNIFRGGNVVGVVANAKNFNGDISNSGHPIEDLIVGVEDGNSLKGICHLIFGDSNLTNIPDGQQLGDRGISFV